MNILLGDVYACLFLIDEDPFIYNKIIRLSKTFREWTSKNPNYVLKMRQNMSVPKRFSIGNGNGGTIWLHRNSYHLNYDHDFYLKHQEKHGGYGFDRYYNGKKYKIERDIHRLDGPAIEWDDGVKEYRHYGLLHREDGPAIEFGNEVRYIGVISSPESKNCQGVWFYNGKPHRIGGPVFEGRYPFRFAPSCFGIGDQEYLPFRELCYGPQTIWCENGLLHRIGGPAQYNEWSEQWYIWGKLHRDDGPAVIKRKTMSGISGIYHEYYNHGQLLSTIVKDLDDPNKILAVYPEGCKTYPLSEPEIINLRPPEKLVGFYSNLFNAFKNKTTSTFKSFFNLWLFRILFQPFQKLFTIGN